MATFLITGANRGLGLEFVRQYAAAGEQVIACCRNAGKATALQDLAANFSNIRIEELDVTQFNQIDQLAAKLEGTAIDVLINNAGVYGDQSGKGLGHLDYADWSRTLLINAQAPVKMAEAFLPHLQAGKQRLIVAVSSLMGSLADNSSGGSILYRSSKAALNAAMKSVSIDLKAQAIGVVILHPGWVLTDMGGPNALISSEVSIKGMRQVISAFKPEQSGSFLKYDGSVMPW